MKNEERENDEMRRREEDRVRTEVGRMMMERQEKVEQDLRGQIIVLNQKLESTLQGLISCKLSSCFTRV